MSAFVRVKSMHLLFKTIHTKKIKSFSNIKDSSFSLIFVNLHTNLTRHSSCKYVSSHFNLADRGCHGFIILGMPITHYAKKWIWLTRAFWDKPLFIYGSVSSPRRSGPRKNFIITKMFRRVHLYTTMHFRHIILIFKILKFCVLYKFSWKIKF